MIARRARGPWLGAALAGLCAAMMAVAGLAAAPAFALTVTYQGTAGHPFAFQPLPATLRATTGVDGSQSLSLSFGVLGRIDASSPVYAAVKTQGGIADPRSIQVLANGDYLFADRTGDMVAETTPAGVPVWTYTAADDPDLQRPFSAQRFTVDGQQLTLIADRNTARVFAVDQQKHVVWQYGTTNQPGLGVNQLVDPFCATYTSAGTVLIADNNGGNRVIEVRWSDYKAGAPSNGFSASSILWEYGTPGVSGSGADQLEKPRSPQRLANGDMLIADSQADRVIVVNRASKQITWQFGQTDQPGDGPDSLNGPDYAQRLADGGTLIVDTGNQRVLLVPADGGTPTVYDMSVLGRPAGASSTDQGAPRGALITANGSLVVADSAFGQITTLGYVSSAKATSTALDCGQPGQRKAFVRLTWHGDVSGAGTAVAVAYSIDGGGWRNCRGIGTSRAYSFPAGTVGKTLAYRVTLTTAKQNVSPVLDSLMIQTMKPSTGGGEAAAVASPAAATTAAAAASTRIRP